MDLADHTAAQRLIGAGEVCTLPGGVLCVRARPPERWRLYQRAPGAGGEASAGFALLHEPLPDLYDELPLGTYDPATERFWRRVMRIARLPGGPWLIGLLARRGR
ncbi:MAG: hypothetical protein KGL34_13730 [Gammaproteobacteria bacterium]|nr:hypothetical protein [Gammaproteobacteria bacterium]